MSLFLSHQPVWDSAPLLTSPERHVAFSVAEAALKSNPASPSVNHSMMDLMEAQPIDDRTWPKTKSHRATSFAASRRPLWAVVEHAKNRREREKVPSSLPRSAPTSSNIEDFGAYQEVTLTTHSADPSPVIDGFFDMQRLECALPRLSARDFAAKAEKNAAAVAHARTMSDAQQSPTQRVRAPQAYRPNTRLPSLAQIQAKMNRASGGYHQGRSDSVDSVDSDGPQTPTDESTCFDLGMRRPMTPDSPLSPLSQSKRLAPFLRERTNGRLARPKSLPPLVDDDDDEVTYRQFRTVRQMSLPPTPPMAARPVRQMSLPPTPQGSRWRQSSLPPVPGTPSRLSREGITLVVTPPKGLSSEHPTSPTESVSSAASSSTSLPIITCTPAAEQDSDEESEGDVIVFSGEFGSEDEEEEEDRREREQRGLEMRTRLQRRSS